MAKEPTEKKSGGHRATFASDKHNPGKYLIRVEGPHAGVFAGRVVPVHKKDGSSSEETLEKCIWLGTDDESGKPVALYRFTEKEKERTEPDAIPF